MIGAPPEESGASQLTVAAPLPATAVTVTGALGSVEGVTDADRGVEGPNPTPLAAFTETRYGVPVVSPGIVQVNVAVVQVEMALPLRSNAVAT